MTGNLTLNGENQICAQLSLALQRPHLDQIARDLVHLDTWADSARWHNQGLKMGTVFGSARTAPASPTYSLAESLGAALVDNGWVVITGGGPGVMQAVRDGAGEERSRAVRIDIEGEIPETTLDASRSVTVESFALRKVMLIQGVDAIWALPGGVGTMDELFEVLVLQDTKRLPIRPVVLVEPPESTYWKSWFHFMEESLIAGGMVSPEILTHVHRATTVDEALARVEERT